MIDWITDELTSLWSWVITAWLPLSIITAGLAYIIWKIATHKKDETDEENDHPKKGNTKTDHDHPQPQKAKPMERARAFILGSIALLIMVFMALLFGPTAIEKGNILAGESNDRGLGTNTTSATPVQQSSNAGYWPTDTTVDFTKPYILQLDDRDYDFVYYKLVGDSIRIDDKWYCMVSKIPDISHGNHTIEFRPCGLLPTLRYQKRRRK